MMVETGSDSVLAEITDAVGIVTLNRSERRNALDVGMYDVVPQVLDRFETDPEVRCILITGAGSAFCAGGDVKDGGRRRDSETTETDSGTTVRPRRPNAEEAGAHLTRSARMVQCLHDSAKVTIAALPGAAVGAGMGITLATDLRIAAESATLVPGWGQLGFSGDFGGTWFLTRLVGPSKAIELYVDNVAIDSATALSLGLVNKVVPDAVLREEALAWAARIASGSSIAQRYFKANVRQAERLTLAEALPLESERMARSGQTDEHRAAVKAWMAAAEAKRVARSGE